MANTIKLEIVTPEGTVYSEDVDMVTLPGIEGQMGVYAHHVPLMTQMVPGEIIVRQSGADYFLAVGEGLIEVTGEHVAILTDMNGRKDSRNLILRFMTDCIFGLRASPMMLRSPSALGPNSIRPWNHPTTLPAASSSEILSSRDSSECFSYGAEIFFRYCSISAPP